VLSENGTQAIKGGYGVTAIAVSFAPQEAWEPGNAYLDFILHSS
jgi:hypothetical protein